MNALNVVALAVIVIGAWGASSWLARQAGEARLRWGVFVLMAFALVDRKSVV